MNNKQNSAYITDNTDRNYTPILQIRASFLKGITDNNCFEFGTIFTFFHSSTVIHVQYSSKEKNYYSDKI